MEGSHLLSHQQPPANRFLSPCLPLPTGIACMTVPVYIAEASPPHLRGQLVTLNTLFITGGQFTASLVDGAFSYLQHDGWRSDSRSAGVEAVDAHTHTHAWQQIRTLGAHAEGAIDGQISLISSGSYTSNARKSQTGLDA